MLWRVVLTAIAISYLVCVLWLSGLQKEDLDVNLLKKLQRHNVNIDDMDRDGLQNGCIKSNARKRNSDVERNITTEDEDTTVATTTTVEYETTNKFNKLEPNNFSKLLAKLMNGAKPMSKENDKISQYTVHETNTEVSEIETDAETLVVTDSKSPYLRDTKAIPKTFKTIGTDVEVLIEDTQPNMEKILSFWKMFTTPRASHITVPVTKTTRTTHRAKKKPHKNVTKYNSEKSSEEIKHNVEKSSKEIKDNAERSSKEMKNMSKYFADYFYEKVKSFTTPSNIISTTVDLSNLNKLSQQFDKFFKLLSDRKVNSASSHITDKEIPNRNPIKYDVLSDDNDFFGKNIQQQALMVRAKNNEYIETNSKNHIIRDISDLLLYNDRLKKSSMMLNESSLPSYAIQSINSKMKNFQYFGLPEWALSTTLQPSTQHSSYEAKTYAAKKEDVKVLPKTVMDEIAENVKAMVLKNLREEITLTTIGNIIKSTIVETSTMATDTTTPATTTVVTTTQAKENKSQDKSILKNLMELFKEFQMLKEQADSLTTCTPKPSENKNTQKGSVRNPPENNYTYEVYNNPSIIENNMPLEKMDTVVVRRPPEIPYLFKAFEPQMIREYNTPINNMQHENVIINNPLLFKANTMRATSIIQTNSGEVPPLGIPISKPSRLIHQNIIVITTGLPPLRNPDSRELQTLNRYTNTNYRDSTRNERDRIRNYLELNQSNPIYASHYNSNPYKYSPIPEYNSQLTQYRSYIPQHNSKPSQYDSNPSEYRQFLDFKDSYKEPTHSVQNYMSRPRNIDMERSNFYTARHDNVPMTQIEKGYRENIDRDPNKHHKDNISVSLFRNQDSGRFHERLEKADDLRDENRNLKEVEKCCSDTKALASRQQLALNPYKTRYDDTHFRDFLKTQQKVNNMLERILATKTYDPPSLEIL